jgi:hypothetical protein
VYQQGDYHLVSPCLYLDVRIKQKDSSGPLRLLLPQVRISLLLFCYESTTTPNQGVRCSVSHTPQNTAVRENSRPCVLVTHMARSRVNALTLVLSHYTSPTPALSSRHPKPFRVRPGRTVAGARSGVRSGVLCGGVSSAAEPTYCDQKVANREIRVWHFVIENGY